MPPIPCFLNRSSGTAAAVAAKLEGSAAVELRALAPERIEEAIRQAVRAGAKRVAVAGGDGTLASAAAVLAGTATELAVIPAGTLNHFAKHLDLPTNPAEAAEVAATGVVRAVDVAYVNERLVLNTSCVGAYVRFVRAREWLERWLGYYVSSLLAAGWILWALRPFQVELVVEGVARRYESTLLFVSVGERDLKPEDYGHWPAGGRRGLHVMVARGGGRWRLMRFALAVARRSRVRGERTPTFDSFLVDHCHVTFPRRHGNVATDGEIVGMTSPLEYRIARDTLKVVVPATGS